MNKYLEEKINLHETSWKSAYPLFSRVITKFHLRTGVEIGVAFGGHSEAILNQTNIDKLYAVDRYQHDPSYDDPLNFVQDQFDELYGYVKDRLSVFGDRCELIRLDSKKAAQTVPDELDFVYIDALAIKRRSHGAVENDQIFVYKGHKILLHSATPIMESDPMLRQNRPTVKQ